MLCEFEQMKQKLPVFVPSRLFIYYNERVIEHTVASDSGAQIRDGIKSVANQGDCPETEWPYDIDQVCRASRRRRATRTPRSTRPFSTSPSTQNLADMQGCLASGYPFVFGFTVYASFESAAVAKTGNDADAEVRRASRRWPCRPGGRIRR